MEGLSPYETSIDGSRRKRRRGSTDAMGESPRELGRMRTSYDAGSSSFVGSGSGIHFVGTVRRALARNGAREQLGDGPEEELVPGEDDQLRGQSTPSSLWREGEVLLEDDGALSAADLDVDFEDLVRWSRPYFESWHPPFPFLHAPTVLEILEKVSSQGLSRVSPTESIIVRSIMSISLADRRQLPNEPGRLLPARLVFRTIDEALSILQPLIIQSDSLFGLQAIVSIQVFLISMLRLNAASRLGGLIVRTLFHLGLHRCPSRFSQFAPADADIRRRVFWAIYCLERYLSQSLGLPLDLKDDDLDVCYPGNEHHSSPTNNTGNGTDEAQHAQQRNLLLPTFLAKHGRIKGLILELRNKSVLHSHSSTEEVTFADSEISRWWNEAQDLLDETFSFDGDYLLRGNGQSKQFSSFTPPSHAARKLKSSHRLLLIVQKHESVILLNRPVITSGYNTSMFAAAMQKCIGASKAIIFNVSRHLSKGVEAEGTHDGRIHDPLFWPGFVWMVWQSGLIILYAATEGHYSVDVAQREADRCVTILENLSLRGNFWPGACSAAIRELQSALKMKTDALPNNSGEQGSMTPGQPYFAENMEGLSFNPKLDRVHTQYGREQSYRDSIRRRDDRGINLQNEGMRRSMTTTETSKQQASTSAKNSNHPYHFSGPTHPNTYSLNHALKDPNSQTFEGASRSHSSTNSSNLLPNQAYGKTNGVRYDQWAGANADLNHPASYSNGFDNVFQLMDASYVISEQIADMYPSSLGNWNLHPTNL